MLSICCESCGIDPVRAMRQGAGPYFAHAMNCPEAPAVQREAFERLRDDELFAPPRMDARTFAYIAAYCVNDERTLCYGLDMFGRAIFEVSPSTPYDEHAARTASYICARVDYIAPYSWEALL